MDGKYWVRVSERGISEKKRDKIENPYLSWLVVLGFNGPLRQYFSLYRAVSQREGERGKKG